MAETTEGYRRILKTLVGFSFGPYIGGVLNYVWETVFLETTPYDDPIVWA